MPFGLIFAGNRVLMAKNLKKQVVEALHFGHDSSTEMYAGCTELWWSPTMKDIEDRCISTMACFNSSKSIKF